MDWIWSSMCLELLCTSTQSSYLKWVSGGGLHSPRHQTSRWLTTTEKGSIGWTDARFSRASVCHTQLSKENQVQTYMHARIKFHAYSDIKVNTETVSRKKKKDYQRFTLNPGNRGSKHHRQSTGGCVRLAPATSSWQLPLSEQQCL
jgi:hypothetical protein